MPKSVFFFKHTEKKTALQSSTHSIIDHMSCFMCRISLMKAVSNRMPKSVFFFGNTLKKTALQQSTHSTILHPISNYNPNPIPNPNPTSTPKKPTLTQILTLTLNLSQPLQQSFQRTQCRITKTSRNNHSSMRPRVHFALVWH